MEDKVLIIRHLTSLYDKQFHIEKHLKPKCFSKVHALQFPDPDVPVTDWFARIAMIL
jgi:hypothetical protein